uniref:Secreted protein n=1 Tax=Picea glauca TaxID=3330 RepID=A0A117NID7_PICGL|nr:hypothetical protein ABT39_MTgene3032 [Picea glauca]
MLWLLLLALNLSIPIVWLDNTMPRVNYVALYLICSILTNKEPFHSDSPSLDLGQMFSPLGESKPFPPIGPSECSNLHPLWGNVFP